MMAKRFKITLIGFGHFGQLVVQYLRREFELAIFSKKKPKNFSQAIANSKIVILAVPISNFREALREVSPHLKEKSLVVDVCSVKEYPVDLMKKNLPKKVEILATHPLFGPDTAKRGLENLKIVLFPARIEKKRYAQIKKWLRQKGLKLIEISAQEHDRLVAETQALAHLIGRVLEKMRIGPTVVNTPSFQKLLELKESVTKDTFQLFKDIQKFNPYTKKVRQNLKRALQKVEKLIESN